MVVITLVSGFLLYQLIRQYVTMRYRALTAATSFSAGLALEIWLTQDFFREVSAKLLF